MAMKQVEEILVDEAFIDWASNQTSKRNSEWVQWMLAHPEQKNNVDEALKLFKYMKLAEINVSEHIIEQEKSRLLNSLNEVTKPAKVVNFKFYKWMTAVAASVILFIGAAYVFNTLYGNTEQKTGYGQIAEKQLPDGTSVILNSNSSVKYAANWEKSKEREVWIQGEAFFQVTKKVNHQRFVVHADKFDVIVTGTKFNVLNRKNKETIMLQEGGVTVRFLNGKEMKLIPGESIEYNGATVDVDHLKPEKAKQDKVLAWVNKRLYFENTSLNEVCQKINELYGIEMELGADSALIGKRTITGILPNDNLEVLLQSLEATADFKIEHNGNKVMVNLPN